MSSLITPAVYNAKAAEEAFNQNYLKVYCVSSEHKKVTQVVTTIEEARLFFNTNHKKNAIKLISKFKKFTKEEIAQRFLKWVVFGKHLDKNN